MKKIFFAAVLLLCFHLTAVHARLPEVPDINAKLVQAFKSQFPAATEAEWSTGSNYYKVCFVYNQSYVNAYYSPEGEFLATIRNIPILNLPVTLQASIKNEFPDYWITELYELSKNDSYSYSLTLENADRKIVLKSTNGSKWTPVKKSEKV